MRHYEIVFIVHTYQSYHVPFMIYRYIYSMSIGGGKVDRI